MSADDVERSAAGISTQTAISSIMAGGGTLHNTTEDLALAMHVAAASESSSSFHAPYFSTLPSVEDFDGLPRRWSERRIRSVLRGSPLVNAVLEQKLGLVADYRKIVACLPDVPDGSSPLATFEAFEWAMAVIASRAFVFGDGPSSTECLVPLADMMNHLRPRETSYRLVRDDSEGTGETAATRGGCAGKSSMLESLTSAAGPSGAHTKGGVVVSQALVQLACGKEVHETYGAKGSAHLLKMYGFALPHRENTEPDGSCNDTRPVVVAGETVDLRVGPKRYTFPCLSRAVDVLLRGGRADSAGCNQGGEAAVGEAAGETVGEGVSTLKGKRSPQTSQTSPGSEMCLAQASDFFGVASSKEEEGCNGDKSEAAFAAFSVEGMDAAIMGSMGCWDEDEEDENEEDEEDEEQDDGDEDDALDEQSLGSLSEALTRFVNLLDFEIRQYTMASDISRRDGAAINQDLCRESARCVVHAEVWTLRFYKLSVALILQLVQMALSTTSEDDVRRLAFARQVQGMEQGTITDVEECSFVSDPWAMCPIGLDTDDDVSASAGGGETVPEDELKASKPPPPLTSYPKEVELNQQDRMFAAQLALAYLRIRHPWGATDKSLW